MWTLIKAIVTVLFSSIGETLILLTSDYELHSTNTANIGSAVTKLAIFMLLNSYVVAVLAVIIAARLQSGQSAEESWCGATRL
jgi:hypothetical protein